MAALNAAPVSSVGHRDQHLRDLACVDLGWCKQPLVELRSGTIIIAKELGSANDTLIARFNEIALKSPNHKFILASLYRRRASWLLSYDEALTSQIELAVVAAGAPT